MFLIGRCFKSGGVSNRAVFVISNFSGWQVDRWSKPFDAPLHITENDEEDIDELYRNEIVIEDN